MIKLKEKLKGTIFHKLYTRYYRSKQKLIGFACSKLPKIKKQYLEEKFYKTMGYKMNWENPKTFNQKIQFRKVFDKNPLYALCSDKYRVREYVKEKIGEEYLIPLHLVTDRLTEEHWEKLPNQCVIKANHNSGPVQIILDKAKVDKYKVIKEINRQLKEKYGLISMESYYDDIKPMVTVEKLIKDKNKSVLDDYKIYCFNRNNKFKCFVQVIAERKNGSYKADFYSENWENLGFYLGGELMENKLTEPKNLKEMIKISKKLSEDFDYARIDLYNLDGKIYFGEITFCPNSGLKSFKPDNKWDEKLGSYWDQKITE